MKAENGPRGPDSGPNEPQESAFGDLFQPNCFVIDPNRLFGEGLIQRCLRGYDISLWNGLFGPAQMPPAIATRLNKEFNEVLRGPPVWQKLQKAGVDTKGGTLQELPQRIRDEVERVQSIAPATMKAGG